MLKVISKKKKEKGTTYKGVHYKYNPWAVCNKSTGGKEEDPKKFEDCVKHVKEKSKSTKKEKK